MRRFLIVEPDEQLANMLEEACRELCAAEVLLSLGEITEEVLRWQPDLAIIDVILPERFDVVCVTAEHQVPGLLISSYDEAEEWCQRFGLPHLLKPFSLYKLHEMTQLVLSDVPGNVTRLQHACDGLRRLGNGAQIIGHADLETVRQLGNLVRCGRL